MPQLRLNSGGEVIDYSPLYRALEQTPLVPWLKRLPEQVARALDPARHGDLPRWLEVLQGMPHVEASSIDLRAATVRVGERGDCDEATREVIEAQLRKLHPWRKGPFTLHGVTIDTEWRSDWKWDRVAPHLAPLEGRLVLDVGCGNGYYGWRMAAEGARLAVGIDPTLSYVMQFHAVRHFAGDHGAWVLPLGIQDLPASLSGFDTLFSMGVLYHRRSPIDHLLELKRALRPGGELVLETLVIEGGLGEVLLPRNRYARMNNVWFIPSCPTLVAWMERCGFTGMRVVDVTRTTVEEQRATDWMQFESLADFLDPADPSRTVEGLPAPIRAVVIANRP